MHRMIWYGWIIVMRKLRSEVFLKSLQYNSIVTDMLLQAKAHPSCDWCPPRRAGEEGWRQLVIFPEGTNTNGQALVRVSLLPLCQPLASLSTSCPSVSPLLLCQPLASVRLFPLCQPLAPLSTADSWQLSAPCSSVSASCPSVNPLLLCQPLASLSGSRPSVSLSISNTSFSFVPEPSLQAIVSSRSPSGA